jgi:hypothetical protein
LVLDRRAAGIADGITVTEEPDDPARFARREPDSRIKRIEEGTMPTDIKTRMRLVLVGWLLGSAVVVGLAVVEPAWLPLEDHAAVCGVTAGLAGIAVVFALHRWRPQALPAWVLSPGGGR